MKEREFTSDSRSFIFEPELNPVQPEQNKSATNKVSYNIVLLIFLYSDLRYLLQEYLDLSSIAIST